MRVAITAATLAVLLAAAGTAQSQPAATAPEDQQPTGYDHVWHDGYVAVAGAEAIPCRHCHNMDARGRILGVPGHTACFGTCHGKAPPRRRLSKRKPQPYPIAEERLPFCTPCHSPTALRRAISGSSEKLAVFYPPYRIELDYGVLLSHAKHDAPSMARGACLACHSIPGSPASKRKQEVHQRCTPCHLKPKSDLVPNMEACTACHRAAFGPATTPHRNPSKYPVARKFSHLEHLARPAAPPLPGGAPAPRGAPTTGERCRTCHLAVTRAEGENVPTPSSAECESCHDGATAFSTVGVECARCHVEPTERVPRPPPPKVWPRFSHAAHRREGLQADCRDCHSLGPDAVPLPASRDHEPCAKSGCHAADFAALEPKTCLACHSGSEPWRPLHTERRAPAETEFGARFSHRQHLAGAAPILSKPCTSCHNTESRWRDMRLPRDHSTCTGSGCHGREATPAPDLANCAGCHEAGAAAARRKSRDAQPWSVRRQFRHAPHTAPQADGTPAPACTVCHDNIADSRALDDIATPKKEICAPCHDGRVAFKLTGQGCVRCHGK